MVFYDRKILTRRHRILTRSVAFIFFARFDEEFDFDVEFKNLQEHSLKVTEMENPISGYPSLG